MKYITNAFNTKMITNKKHLIKVEPCSYSEIMQNKREAVNAIGHRKLAKLFHLKPHRIQIQLTKGDIAYVVSTTSRKHQLYDEPDNIEYKKITVIE